MGLRLILVSACILALSEGSSLTETCVKNKCAIFDIALDAINKAKEHCLSCNAQKPVDCEDLQAEGVNKSGTYTIRSNNKWMDINCDMQTDGGGWTVIQRRGDYKMPKDYFYQDWKRYRAGFGNLSEDFWLGNDKIFSLTNQKLYSVRFDLKAVDGEKRYALYDTFWIEDETSNYRLHIEGYSGNAGNSMGTHNNRQFSTKDAFNENGKTHCAQVYKGAWWYSDCHKANLNGLYLKGKHTSYGDGVNWYDFKGYHESLDTTEIKIRSKNFRKKS